MLDPSKPVGDFTFVAFDFETTGLHAARDRIVEFGAVRFAVGRELATFQQMANPGCAIHPDRGQRQRKTAGSDVFQPGKGCRQAVPG